VVTRWLLFGIGFDISARVVASLTRSWKRWMAVSCTHGHLADPRATKAMLAFRRAYKPANVLHLGDFTDMAALRAGQGEMRMTPTAPSRWRMICSRACRSSKSLSRPPFISEITKTVFANSRIAAARWSVMRRASPWSD
jgi:hypothetical protein